MKKSFEIREVDTSGGDRNATLLYFIDGKRSTREAVRALKDSGELSCFWTSRECGKLTQGCVVTVETKEPEPKSPVIESLDRCAAYFNNETSDS